MVAPPRPDPLERYVVVDGSGSLMMSLARLLRAEGVRSVDAGPWAADSADAELRRDGRNPAPDLVVLARSGRVDPRAGEPWRRRGTPHLPVAASGSRVVVGPWLTGDPGQPCLGCLIGDPGGSASPPSDAVVATGAGLAALVVLAGLTGRALPPGVTVELRAPWPRVEHRRWSRDLGCPLHEDAARPSGRQAAAISLF